MEPQLGNRPPPLYLRRLGFLFLIFLQEPKNPLPGNVGNEEEVAVEARRLHPVHPPGEASRGRVGVRPTAVRQRLALHRHLAARRHPHAGCVAHRQQHRHRAPRPVRNVGRGAGKGAIVMPPIDDEADDRGGVEPLAVFEADSAQLDVVHDDVAVAVVPEDVGGGFAAGRHALNGGGSALVGFDERALHNERIAGWDVDGQLCKSGS
jgi:hypothetical protein